MTIVVSDVAASYFNLIELDNELEIDKRTLATREESLRIIKLKQQGGLATLLARGWKLRPPSPARVSTSRPLSQTPDISSRTSRSAPSEGSSFVIGV